MTNMKTLQLYPARIGKHKRKECTLRYGRGVIARPPKSGRKPKGLFVSLSRLSRLVLTVFLPPSWSFGRNGNFVFLAQITDIVAFVGGGALHDQGGIAFIPLFTIPGGRERVMAEGRSNCLVLYMEN